MVLLVLDGLTYLIKMLACKILQVVIGLTIYTVLGERVMLNAAEKIFMQWDSAEFQRSHALVLVIVVDHQEMEW
tara:strand:- start:1592 stop:1813 length:222 start_codon:yes stop_codon:yes gene_type:complete